MNIPIWIVLTIVKINQSPVSSHNLLRPPSLSSFSILGKQREKHVRLVHRGGGCGSDMDSIATHAGSEEAAVVRKYK
jgi:hypothetical protein